MPFVPIINFYNFISRQAIHFISEKKHPAIHTTFGSKNKFPSEKPKRTNDPATKRFEESGFYMRTKQDPEVDNKMVYTANGKYHPSRPITISLHYNTLQYKSSP